MPLMAKQQSPRKTVALHLRYTWARWVGAGRLQQAMARVLVEEMEALEEVVVVMGAIIVEEGGG